MTPTLKMSCSSPTQNETALIFNVRSVPFKNRGGGGRTRFLKKIGGGGGQNKCNYGGGGCQNKCNYGGRGG